MNLLLEDPPTSFDDDPSHWNMTSAPPRLNLPTTFYHCQPHLVFIGNRPLCFSSTSVFRKNSPVPCKNNLEEES